MNLLIIGPSDHQLLKNLVKTLQNHDKELRIDAVSFPRYFNNSGRIYNQVFNLSDNFPYLKNIPVLRIFYFILNLNKSLNSLDSYDHISIHFVRYFYFFSIRIILKKTSFLSVSFWGSDYYRINRIKKYLLKRLLNRAERITCANEEMIIKIGHELNIKKNRFTISRFGLQPLMHISEIMSKNSKEQEKHKLGFGKKILVTIGYSAHRSQQHIEVIKSLNLIEQFLPSNILLLFPMTYGDFNSKKYIQEVENILAKSTLNYIIYKKFMSDENIASIRYASDIMIQVNVTDQFSGSMQEHLFAENIIITGEWLPYTTLKSAGIFFLEVSALNQIGDKLLYSIANRKDLLLKCKDNKSLINNFSGWENTIQSWLKLYSK
jgi:hypothetical protein